MAHGAQLVLGLAGQLLLGRGSKAVAAGGAAVHIRVRMAEVIGDGVPVVGEDRDRRASNVAEKMLDDGSHGR